MVWSCGPCCGSGSTVPDKSPIRRWRPLTVFGGASPCRIAPSSGLHQTAADGSGYRRMCSSTISPRNSEPNDGIHLSTPQIPRKFSLRPEARISLALACSRINRGRPPRGYGCRRIGDAQPIPHQLHRHPARRELGAVAPAAQHRGPGGRATLNLQGPPSPVHVVRGFRPRRAYGEVRVHLAPVEVGAATPAAQHPRPRWVSTLNLRERPSPVPRGNLPSQCPAHSR
jgi:hypothetical protein